MTKISQYPEIAIPDFNDLLIGTDVENSNVTKNFTIQSIVDLTTIPTLQQVTDVGNDIVVDANVAEGVNITLSNNSTVYQNGIIVTVPAQTGEYPQYNPAPDAFIAYLNGQNPGTLAGNPVGFISDMSGADNYGFIAQLNANASNSVGYLSRSYDTHTGNLYEGIKIIGGTPSEVFKVDNDGDITAKSFIKTNGTSSQYLMADGSALSNIATNTTTTQLSLVTLNSTYPNAIVGFRVHCASITSGKLIYEKISAGWVSYSITLIS